MTWFDIVFLIILYKNRRYWRFQMTLINFKILLLVRGKEVAVLFKFNEFDKNDNVIISLNFN